MKEFFRAFAGYTTDDDLKKVKALMEGKDKYDNPFADMIRSEMEYDSDSRWTDLYDVYESADEEERAICDSLMAALCGWTFHSIIDMVGKEAEGEKR